MGCRSESGVGASGLRLAINAAADGGCHRPRREAGQALSAILDLQNIGDTFVPLSREFEILKAT
ncbi:hypothetical protein CBM2615_B150114 [Cupriavidus taiwanensis]|uniref:Uncharacterized protein n=1 Tax=Cupriavidus taiwanensis TaxID=164546 RepID=A0A976B0T6_9BURK|nr:hypothetical protein CBM2614_B160118 [Cupriavidus taiwanensis]SOZ65145.1 hypothetical protein CBM2615_B150114 [Cupriavidus taiwanensis]SOZ68808.1 hypothetical protein CBM2613_B120114 [Cupriavidus taiwanensis]SPA08237.1 hypothetical protein CBM2625_B120113 [Cupriavidus taiwanensis]